MIFSDSEVGTGDHTSLDILAGSLHDLTAALFYRNHKARTQMMNYRNYNSKSTNLST